MKKVKNISGSDLFHTNSGLNFPNGDYVELEDSIISRINDSQMETWFEDEDMLFNDGTDDFTTYPFNWYRLIPSGCSIDCFSGECVSDAIHNLREMFFQADPQANKGYYRVKDILGGGAHRFCFNVPGDFHELESLKLIGIVSNGAAQTSRDVDFYSDYASADEAYNIHSESDTTSTYDLSGHSEKIYEFDISSVFSNIVAGDYCGLLVDHKAIGSAIYYLGIKIKYM